MVTTGSTTLPSLDLIIEGRAKRVTNEGKLRAITDVYRSKLEWPLEVRDGRVVGPNAPTAGPPAYVVFRLAPSRIFGLPGMLGMEQFDPEDMPRPTRWDFAPTSR